MTKPAVCAEFCSNKKKVDAAKRRLPQAAQLRANSEIYSLLADPGRLAILLALAGDELCVCDLSQVLDAGISAVSHQLRILRAAGLVCYRNQGKLVFYSYTGGPLIAKALRGLKPLSEARK
jgi:DNA-binding transcriptional ArsR family regulator